MPSRDDRETSWTLLRQLHAHDEEAWRRFMAEYHPRILGRCRTLLDHSNEADAEELAGEVLAELVRELPRFEYDPRRRFGAWLQAVIEHTYLDWQRRKQRRPRLVPVRIEPAFLAPWAEELETAITEKTERIHRAVREVRQEVGEQRWEAFWAYLTREGVTAAEVGEEFAMTAARVRVDFQRILEKVRRRLERPGPPGAEAP